MQKMWIVLALLVASATSAPAVSAVTPGKVQVFKDWTVGCDNGLDCQAVALMDENAPDGHLSVVVTRSAGRAAPLTVAISTAASKAGSYSVRVDGRSLARDISQVQNQPIRLVGPAALKLARAMARGNFIRIFDNSGAEVGRASLAGASASLRYMDGQQGRVGVKDAIVAMGGKSPVGKLATLPVITARKIAPTDILPDTSALVSLSETSPCAAERLGSTEDTAYSLGSGKDGPRALVLLNCGAGAYNFSSGIYMARRNNEGAWKFEPAKFDYGATGFTNTSEVPILVNADWDAPTQTISSYNKGRGLGDCGSSERYVWDGEMFRLTAASFMGECRGSADWIPTWRAEVRLND